MKKPSTPIPGGKPAAIPEPAADTQGLSLKTAWRGLFVTALFFLVVAVATLPKFPYPGDNFVPRNESIQLAKRGMLGIPYAMRELIRGLDEPRGQYFFSNDAKQRYYSKYGIAYTLAYLPPIWAELRTHPEFDLHRQTETFFFKLNLYQILLGLIVVYYLFRLAWLYCASPWICCAFTLATIYSTFLWHYLRAPALEIYQLTAFIGACWHALVFLRRRQSGDASARCWMHLLAATLWSGALVLMKSSYVVLGFAIAAFPFFVEPNAGRFWARPFVSLARHWKAYAWSSIIPWGVIFTVLLTYNAIRFGSAFDNGYMQWAAADGTPLTRFGLKYVWPGAKIFFWQIKGDFNMFNAYPYALLGLLCLVPFARRRLVDALFILAVVIPGVCLLLVYEMAIGQWCYGPRYFLFYAMILALPFLAWFDRVFRRLPKLLKPLIMAFCLVTVLHMTWQQFMVNGLHYFVSYQLGGVLNSTKLPALKNYGNRPRKQFCRELFYYGQGWSRYYYPLEVVRPLIPPERKAEWQQFKAIIDQFAQPNFYFFPHGKSNDPPGESGQR